MQLKPKEYYINGVLEGKRRIIARTITLIESRNPKYEKFGNEILESLLSHTGKSIRLGISGIPGVGKSTFIEKFGLNLIEQGKKVAVLAVDPSSQISGGSIMGDKTRMNELSANTNSFIRPSPSSGSLGGVARKTRETMLICEAAGYDIILIETVGVGQSEVMVSSMVDFFLVMMLPNTGDELQGIKKGIMEFADSIVINKADGENINAAKVAKRQFENVLHILSNKNDDNWEPRVLTCSSVKGNGIQDVIDAVMEHRDIMSKSGELEEHRKTQRKEWMWNILQEGLQSMFKRNKEIYSLIEELENKVLSGDMTPTNAASLILDRFMEKVSKADTLWDLINY
jgi:LAO/AO transport system kinase